MLYNIVSFLIVDYGLDKKTVKPVLKHFQSCKDCAGESAFLMATRNEEDTEDVLMLSK